jgi:hypothetical protein
MRNFQDFQDILNKLKATAPNADDLLRSTVQSDIDAITPEEAMDALKQAPRSRNVIPAEKVGQAINSGKISSFVPEDLNNPSSLLEQMAKNSSAIPEEKGFQLVPKDVYKLREEAAAQPRMPDVEQIRASNAAQKNAMSPLGPNGVLAQGAEPIEASGMPQSMVQAAEEAAAAKSGLPQKVQPIVEGQGTSRAKMPEPPIDAEFRTPTMSNAKFLKGLAMTELPMAVAGEYFSHPQYYNQKIGGMFKDEPPIVPPNVPGTDINGITTPPVFAPMQDAAPKIDEQAPGAAPDSPVAENIEQQGQTPAQEPSRAESLLNAYRSLASEQSTGLRDAQERARNNEMVGNLLKAANIFTSGATGIGSSGVVGPAKVNNEVLDSMVKNADAPVTEYAQQVADQKHDPSSKYSQMMREYLAPKYIQSIEEQTGKTLSVDEKNAIMENLKTVPGDVAEKVVTQLSTESKLRKMEEYKNALLNLKKSSAENQSKKREEDLNLKERRLDTTVENQVNNRLDKNTKDEQSRMQAAKRVQDLIDQVKNGTLIDSPNIRATLTNDLATLALPVGNRATMSDRQKSAINTFSTKANELIQFITNNPTKTIPPKFIRQLEIETRVLKDSYGEALRNKIKSLRAGTSDEAAKKVFEDRYNSFAEDYGLPMGLEPIKLEEKQNTQPDTKQPTQHKPGDVILHKGKQYRVDVDGDNLIPL